MANEKYDVYTPVQLNRDELLVLRELCKQIDNTKMRLNLINRFGEALLQFGSPLFETKVRILNEESEEYVGKIISFINENNDNNETKMPLCGPKRYQNMSEPHIYPETKEDNKFSYNPAPRLVPGPSFHGESWYQCPHCNRGIESHSIDGMIKVRANVYLCPYCSNEFYWKRF